MRIANHLVSLVSALAVFWVSIFLASTSILVVTGQEANAESHETKTDVISELSSLLPRLAFQGFYESREDFDKLNAVFSRDDNSQELRDLSTEEIDNFLSATESLSNAIPAWLDRLERNIKRLEADPNVRLEAGNLDQLRRACSRLEGAVGTVLVGAIQDIKSGNKIDATKVNESLQGAHHTCAAFVVSILAKIEAKAAELEEKIERAQNELQAIKSECIRITNDLATAEAAHNADPNDAEKKSKYENLIASKTDCEQRVTNKEDQIQELTESYNDVQTAKADVDWGKVLGGLVLAAAGAVLSAYGAPQIGGALIAAGATVFEEGIAQDETSTVVQISRVTGRERVLSDANNATQEELDNLDNLLQTDGFEKVTFNGVPDGIQVSIFRKDNVWRVFLGGKPEVAFEVRDGNTSFSPNALGVSSLSAITSPAVQQQVFGSNNIVEMNLEVTLTNGKRYKAGITETDVGTQQYVFNLGDPVEK